MNYFSKKEFAKVFIPLFVTIYVVLLGLGYILFRQQKNHIIDSSSTYYKNLLFQQETLIDAVLKPSVSNLMFLRSQNEVAQFLNDTSYKSELVREMHAMAQHNWNYKQIRFIDDSGMERIRLNWEDDSLIIVPENLLQDKSARPYFKHTMQLSKNSIYISEVDLNIEHGKIEVPFQPVIRFSSPIYLDDGSITGIIIINQFLNEFLSQLQKNLKDLNGEFSILNNDGYWLLGPESFQPFGFMFDSLKDERLDKYDRDLWNQIVQKHEGVVVKKDTLYVSHNLQFNSLIGNSSQDVDETENLSNWILLFQIPINVIDGLVLVNNIFNYGIVVSLLLAFFVSYLYSKNLYEERIYIQSLNEINSNLEESIRQRTLLLEQSNSKLQAVNDELEAFSYSISHDLKAPLRHISGFSDLLLKKFGNEVPEQAVYYLNNIKTASKEMGQLIEDLLQFSRIGRTSIKNISFEMGVLVNEVVLKIKNDTETDAIQWKINQLPTVIADYSLMRQVWINLISNAVKYSSKSENPKIEIGYEELDSYFRIYIRDNGVGFDMKYVDKLFGAFQRLHSNDEFDGTGIGLAIVKRIITKHSGEISAIGEINSGATFYFTLPKSI